MFCTDDNKFSSYLLEISGITSAVALIPAIACFYSIIIVLRQVHVNLKRLMYIESTLYVIRPIIQTIEIKRCSWVLELHGFKHFYETIMVVML
uniref:Serpentine receptor class gamma n=1 Tax=Panagrellus redivivus TaxID=6233 RepID=A0A7E4UMA7_PANRE